MRKHFLQFICVLLAVVISALFFILPAKANDTSPWITAALNIQKQTDTSSLPISLNGNIDCYRVSSGGCAVPAPYGIFNESNSSLSFSSVGSYKPILNYIEGSQKVLAVPNSNTLISYNTTPVFGWNIFFNDTYAFIKSDSIYTNYGTRDVYKMTAPPSGVLADRSGHLLAADYNSMSFSDDGNWLVAAEPNVATLRVNLRTFEVLPFGPRFVYGIGNPPDIKTAVTEDGRYAIEASYNQNRFAIYDLDTCALPVPDTISGPVNCHYRDLKPYILQQIPGFRSATNIRFLGDDTISFYGTFYDGPTLKTARFILSTKPINTQIPYLALGDSYISGEGAFDYAPGTDTENNTCHLSFLSYSYLINNDLDFNYNPYPSVACSGATTDDIINKSSDYKGQADNKRITRGQRDNNGTTELVLTSFLPGYINQLGFVSHYQPKTITLSIGGNDMGFSKILLRCMEPDSCFSDYEDRVELVREINNIVFPNLVNTYQSLKNSSAPGARIYIIGYPQIAKPDGDCSENVRLDNNEVKFSQQIIAYLDSVINAAADKSGVKYVDVQDAFAGHRLCETNFLDSAMNGITVGDDRPFSFGPIGAESYHPTALGYKLLEEKILAATNNLSGQMPSTNLSASTPSESGLDILNVPKSGRSINVINYDDNVTNDVQYRGGAWNIVYKSGHFLFKAGSKVKVVLKSDPISLGAYDVNQDGGFDISVNATDGIPLGFHTLHIYGTDVIGQPIDIQKVIYISDPPVTEKTTALAGTGSEGNSTENKKTESASPVKNGGIDSNGNQLVSEANAASLQDAGSSFIAPNDHQKTKILGLSTSNVNPKSGTKVSSSPAPFDLASANWRPISFAVFILISIAAVLSWGRIFHTNSAS
ncbi:MAG TPA: SGNH/GDSL hydrolase family protein [Candidatus Saccharimonadales bacterium]|nr:SGNH/GDSL hydrolase family protein [Candidatus Saccharimonadales bacterium]